MADSDFKNKPITFPTNWVCNSKGGQIGIDKYKPDRSFKNEENEVVCVIESSSTNDRKVGVGELCLADKFFTDSKIDGVLIFSLCGSSTSPPRPDTQKSYLEPYFRHLKTHGGPHGVREVYLISENDFESLNWVALDENFKKKAHVLKA
jgi:hypothetical protein